MTKKIYSFFIGRWQCIPIHIGHQKLIKTVLDEGKNILIGFRDTEISEQNPYSVEERMNSFKEVFKDEIKSGRMVLLPMPDIEEVVHGRRVGWGIREIKLDKETEAVSGTQMRKEKKG